MATATLSWFPDRGFELTAELSNDEVALRFESVPVPADGRGELRAGVELNDLDVLFKAVVEIEGQLGQVHEASVKLLERDGKPVIEIDASCEDVETGEKVPFKGEAPVEIPEEAPEAGGPRPEPTTEDDLDFEDDTTLEKFVVGGPEPTPPPASGENGEKGSRGLKALLEALASAEDDEEIEEGDVADTVVSNAPPVDPPKEQGDQSMGATEEARGLLEYLIRLEHLELEEGATVDALVAGVVPILASRAGPEAKASKLGGWLLEQGSVADLFIGDEDLAAILEQW